MTAPSSSDSDDYDDDDFFITNSAALLSDDYPKFPFDESEEARGSNHTKSSKANTDQNDDFATLNPDTKLSQDNTGFSSDSESTSSLEENLNTTQKKQSTKDTVITLSSSSSSDSESSLSVEQTKESTLPKTKTSKKRARTGNTTRSKESNDVIVLDDSGSDLDHESSSETSDREWVPEGGYPVTKKKNRKTIFGQRVAPMGTNSVIDPEEDENDEFYRAIREARGKDTKSTSTGTSTISHNPKRIYNIRFVSKLEGTIDKCVKVKVLGKFAFSKILPLSLEGLVRAYRIPSGIRSKYAAENVTMYWNGAKLLDFMTCDSLKIEQAYENEVSNVEILLFSKEDSRNMEMMYELSLLREEQDVNVDSGKQVTLKDVATAVTVGTVGNGNTIDDNSDLIIEEFEKELEDVKQLSQGAVVSNGTPEADEPLLTEDILGDKEQAVLTISLMGEDNKKLLVKVHKFTKLSKIVEYYRTQKSIPKKAQITIYFDNDLLDQSGSVGDYDIEDEDMLDVMVQL